MNGQLKFYQILAIVFVMSATTLSAQDDGFIYGRVTTIDDNVYTGALRWGKEEIYWTDMFNATKGENENLDLLSREELEYMERRGQEWASRYGNVVKRNWDWEWDDDHIHQFVCQFGEIKAMRPQSRDWVELELQGGQIFEVDGSGTNDVGNKVKVYDPELGIIELSWGRIDLIEFMEAPRNMQEKFGEPLYGTVETDLGSFTGFVQWDHDERVSTDKLDGDTYDGDVSIDFGKIRTIERNGYSMSNVTLKSGRELELRGSNDVNEDNDGIIVTIAGMGRVDIPWKDFRSVTFADAPNSGPDYGSFSSQDLLQGTVRVENGDMHEGQLIFDIDESYEYEILDGKDDDAEFLIPFSNVQSIVPRNYSYSNVVLKNGDKFLLGDTQDVSDENDGILVLNSGGQVYIPWEKIEEVNFK